MARWRSVPPLRSSSQSCQWTPVWCDPSRWITPHFRSGWGETTVQQMGTLWAYLAPLELLLTPIHLAHDSVLFRGWDRIRICICTVSPSALHVHAKLRLFIQLTLRIFSCYFALTGGVSATGVTCADVWRSDIIIFQFCCRSRHFFRGCQRT
jgi:hypothetical protein